MGRCHLGFVVHRSLGRARSRRSHARCPSIVASRLRCRIRVRYASRVSTQRTAEGAVPDGEVPDDEVSGALDDGLLVVDAPAVLTALETSGASLAAMLGGPAGPLDNGAMIALARYASLVRVLEADIGEIARADPKAGVSVARFVPSSLRRALAAVRKRRASSSSASSIGSIARESSVAAAKFD